MSDLSRDELVTLAVERYFANVDKKNLGAVLDCFNEDAVFTIQSHGVVHQGRDTQIREMFETLFEYDTILHTDFESIADPTTQAISSRFRVVLGKDGDHTTLTNVNHWYAKRGRFERVFVWMSGENVLP